MDVFRARRELAKDVLRTGPSHPDWPPGLKWQYGLCESCLIGIVAAWTDRPALPWKEAGAWLGLGAVQADHVLIHANVWVSGGERVLYLEEVTPAMVADVLEEVAL